MPDTEKVIKAWERCKVCNMPPIGSEEGHKAYFDCEYTTGLYCRKDRLIDETIELMKEQQSEIERLKEQKVTTLKPHYIDECGKRFICGVECGACHKEISSTYHYCPWCKAKIEKVGEQDGKT